MTEAHILGPPTSGRRASYAEVEVTLADLPGNL